MAFGDPEGADLPGSFEEVKSIKKIFPSAILFTGRQATKNQLFQIRDAKILHLATHGHILDPVENSNIQLARLSDDEHADLSYGEIYALPSENIEMVVLSACQTALGSVSGTEVGVFVEAFRSKAKTIVASLWSVDDVATNVLMVSFYKKLYAGSSRSAALRAAQLLLLKNPATKHPLFWAAFVMYGENGPL